MADVLKTHAEMLAVTRNEKKLVKRIAVDTFKRSLDALAASLASRHPALSVSASKRFVYPDGSAVRVTIEVGMIDNDEVVWWHHDAKGKS